MAPAGGAACIALAPVTDWAATLVPPSGIALPVNVKITLVQLIGFSALPGFVWVEIEASTMEVDGDLNRDFQYGPLSTAVVALNGRIIPSLSSCILCDTLTDVILAAHVPSATVHS